MPGKSRRMRSNENFKEMSVVKPKLNFPLNFLFLTCIHTHRGSILQMDEMSDGKLLQVDNGYYIQYDIYEELSGNHRSHQSVCKRPGLSDEACFIMGENRNTPV